MTKKWLLVGGRVERMSVDHNLCTSPCHKWVNGTAGSTSVELLGFVVKLLAMGGRHLCLGVNLWSVSTCSNFLSWFLGLILENKVMERDITSRIFGRSATKMMQCVVQLIAAIDIINNTYLQWIVGKQFFIFVSPCQSIWKCVYDVQKSLIATNNTLWTPCIDERPFCSVWFGWIRWWLHG